MSEEVEASVKSGSVPPYVSFASLRNFIRGLGEKGMPGRIDRTVMSSLSGGTQNQVTAALKFFKLVDSLGVPSTVMHKLAESDEIGEKAAWRELIQSAYAFLFQAVNLKTATTGQVTAEFTKLGASGDTNGKCISFFLAASKHAGIAVSAHIRPSRAKNGQLRKRRPGTKSAQEIPQREVSSETSTTPEEAKADVTRMLMEKFPTFDPSWPDNLKTSWFSAYEQLMKRNK
jgi:hypothetical protein